jgi:hypothetical protein
MAKKEKLDPAKCLILLHRINADDSVELDYFDKTFIQKNVEVLNKDDDFETVKQAISLHQLWIPDMFGN